MRLHRLSSLAAGTLSLLAWLAPSRAEAAGFATARFGGEHGHPTTDNATSIYYNPAGLAEDSPDLEKKDWRVKVFADGNFAFRWASWSHDASPSDTPEPAGKPPANSGKADLFNFVAAPMVGASFQVENFGFGLAFYVPFGGQSSWGKNAEWENDRDFAGPVDGVQRWHSIDGILRSMYISAGAAYDILDRISIGASLNIVRSEVVTLRAREASGSNSVDAEGRSLIDVKGWTASMGVGVIGEVAKDKVWLGMSYQSQPGFGDMTLKGTLTNNFAGNVSEPEPVKLIQALPDIFRIGVRARPIKTVEIRVFGDYTNWSTFKNQCVTNEDADSCETNPDGSAVEGKDPPLLNIVRNWGPSFGARMGGSYWVIPELELFLGAGYDSNAIPDSTLEPALTDFQKASLAGGLRFQVGDTFAMALNYTHLFYIERNTQNDDGTSESILPTLQAPSRTPDSGGQYNQTIGVINTNIQLAF